MIADYTNHNILKVEMKTLELTVHAHEPAINQPNDIAIAADNTIYASDPDWAAGTGQIWRIDVDGCVTRLEAVSWETRPATRNELEHMKRRVAEWMEAGAVSLCLGLDYQPSAFSKTEELVELSKVAAAHGGIYAAHIRYNSLGREGAWLETLEIST